jgi:hypothetical protein
MRFENQGGGGWFKSSISNGSGGTNCVEVRHTVDGTQIRDSKNPDGPVLSFTAAEFTAFVDGAKAGDFDR